MPREGIYYFPLKEKFQEINRTCFYIYFIYKKLKSKHPRKENMKRRKRRRWRWSEKERERERKREVEKDANKDEIRNCENAFAFCARRSLSGEDETKEEQRGRATDMMHTHDCEHISKIFF